MLASYIVRLTGLKGQSRSRGKMILLPIISSDSEPFVRHLRGGSTAAQADRVERIPTGEHPGNHIYAGRHPNGRHKRRDNDEKHAMLGYWECEGVKRRTVETYRRAFQDDWQRQRSVGLPSVD